MSIGRLRSKEETQAFILAHLGQLSPNATVRTVVEVGVIISRLTMPVSDLSVTRIVLQFGDLQVTVTAQHVAEV